MTEKGNNLLAVFEDRIADLINKCEDRKRRIAELEQLSEEQNQTIRETKQALGDLETRYASLLAARSIANFEGDFDIVRKRVNKLVREVDTCIKLINE